MNYLLLILNIILLVIGQTFWKIGSSKINFSFSFKGIANTFTNIYVFSGIIIYVAATFIWIYLLSKEELSKIYPLQSLCYIFACIIGITLFKENITIQKIIGTFLILSGAIIICK
ncbi:putative membrane protein [Clostridium tetanomorphum]|uniref:EamA family transporter n=1 Tax=Clostridium tetanomorphum TaxID=1553 RepID=A0A923J013_CLOTT|nr:EamA family transporter [Clostridium tetanomorphum]KAJ53728.1 EamA-like transporter family protein [Clostridium tetanomorphum DSM 665]MBC2397239.1 EamA family transporter [Clostridium tetanomorphum]MBP1862456.1 putative membrane protein [Clostridium tetanomorphum]NRS85704.1 putative membrane protein [Clostridium tetanomorphum]NRZ96286.1 putative membrane protein [Clostridium tetanomorphum]